MPERLGRALLRWIDPQVIRPLFYAGLVTTPADVNGFVALWQAAGAKVVGPRVLAGTRGVQPLPGQLVNEEAAVRQTEQFRSVYEPLGASFASAPLVDLVTPQWWVDSGYVDDLVSSVPAPGNDVALFNFCFATGRLEAPMLLGINSAIIRSGRKDLGTISPLRVEAATPDKVTFWVRRFAQTQLGVAECDTADRSDIDPKRGPPSSCANARRARSSILSLQTGINRGDTQFSGSWTVQTPASDQHPPPASQGLLGRRHRGCSGSACSRTIYAIRRAESPRDRLFSSVRVASSEGKRFRLTWSAM